MLEANSGPIMRGRVFWVLSMLLLCAWSSQPIALEDEVVESSAPTNQQQNWNQIVLFDRITAQQIVYLILYFF